MCLWRLFKKMFQDPRNFVYSSDYLSPYFVYKTETDITTPARSTSTVRIAHGLNFVPLIVGQWSNDSDFTVTHDIFNIGSFDSVYVWCFADDTYIYARQFNGSNNTNTVYVKIFAYAPPDYNGHIQPINDNTEYNFSTDFNYLEIAKSGVIIMDGSVQEVQHGLGYYPQCRFWEEGSYVVDGQSVGVRATGPCTSSADSSEPSPSFVIGKDKVIIGKTYPIHNDDKIYYHIYINEA